MNKKLPLLRLNLHSCFYKEIEPLTSFRGKSPRANIVNRRVTLRWIVRRGELKEKILEMLGWGVCQRN